MLTSERLLAVYRNRLGHVRAVWRFLLYMTLALAAKHGLTSALQEIPWIGDSDGLVTWQAIVERTVQSAGMILAGCTLLRWMDRRPVALMGISLTVGSAL